MRANPKASTIEKVPPSTAPSTTATASLQRSLPEEYQAAIHVHRQRCHLLVRVLDNDLQGILLRSGQVKPVQQFDQWQSSRVRYLLVDDSLMEDEGSVLSVRSLTSD